MCGHIGATFYNTVMIQKYCVCENKIRAIGGGICGKIMTCTNKVRNYKALFHENIFGDTVVVHVRKRGPLN